MSLLLVLENLFGAKYFFFKKYSLLCWNSFKPFGEKTIEVEMVFSSKKKVENNIFRVSKIDDRNKSSIEKITRTITHDT